MLTVFSRFSPWLRHAALGAAVVGTTLVTGCASFYVDTATKDVAASEYKLPAQPKPVQVMFEFQTKGTANAAATGMLKDQVLQQIKQSGLFSDVKATPAEGGALLSVALNNIPLTDDAFSKGFVTGLTFGAAGSQVTDGYVCTLSYSDGPAATPVVKTARHAIHTVLGSGSAPANAVKSEGVEAAVRTMTRQIVGNALRDLSADPSFK